ncbi:glycosyltransferase family 2 protein [Cellulomonas cellasea]|uniref:Glycosyltransferase involved in cell wall biosynthesis n=1 Tax=Cellulomonas cellasea TaxID=43670 RepID=A0A7W4UI32_9CELL|nr:glycosyltransferase family 2 protein [Cellulomonas cellasea]MBB2923958.1 glycosyltransferase involved in cell wall biosynthesis [Cellulomonas cellasea]
MVESDEQHDGPDPSGEAAALSVTVAVLTYLRPDDLREVLPTLVAQAAGLGPRARVLVVDNDPAGSAREVVEALATGARYVHEPEPGIAHARNRALDEAAGDDLLVFVDDDERPCDGWLRLLVEQYLVDRPGAVVGPVVSEYVVEPDRWVRAGRFFDRRRLATGTEVTLAATNNLLLDMHQVAAAGLRFDARFGLTGGSDTLFTHQAVARGLRMVWCDEAVVTDVVPASRVTRSWVLRRAYRSGNGWTRVSVLVAGSPAARLRTRASILAQGSVRVAAGAGQTALGVVTRSLAHEARGRRTLARGSGMLAGLVGHVYAEYARPGTPAPAQPRATGGTVPRTDEPSTGKVTVAIATFRRPATLAHALDRVVEQAERLGPDVRVLVVDNDPDASARELVTGTWAGRVDYCHEPRPGLAAVRNHALDAAASSDAVVFFDDDEVPQDGWLEHLLDAWRRWGCAAVAGPTVRRLAEPVDPWVRASGFFELRPPGPSGTVVPGAGAGNLLLDLRVLRRHGLRFDERFGASGGEDSMLTRALGARGEVVRWCAEAVAEEPVADERATRAWVLRRAYRTGTTWSAVLLALRGTRVARFRQRLVLVAHGAALVVRGGVRTVGGLLTRSLARRAQGEVHVASGWGALVGAAGVTYAEYARGRDAGAGAALGSTARAGGSSSAAVPASAHDACVPAEVAGS